MLMVLFKVSSKSTDLHFSDHIENNTVTVNQSNILKEMQLIIFAFVIDYYPDISN